MPDFSDGQHDWRDAARYSRLRGIDRAGLMWEWLRRDPNYIAWYARASRVTRGTENPLRWGLHFRRRPPSRRAGGHGHLERRIRPRHAARGGDACHDE